MDILIGLGNPGEKYENTRHNVGFMFCDLIAEVKAGGEGWEKKKGLWINRIDNLFLVKSAEYFMNESGKIIEDLQYLGKTEGKIYVIHDDLDMKLGEYKIQFGKGPQLHGGLNDIERVMGASYWRIRVGVDSRDTDRRIPGEEYVLQNFLPEELDKLQSVLNEIAKRFT